MGYLRNKWAIASLVLLCWAAVTTSTTIYFYSQYNSLLAKVRGVTIHVNLGINYGDGRPTEWHNGTEVELGSTLLDVTMKVATVNYTIYPGMGAFVNSINGVENSPPFYWMWWMWTAWGGWVEGPVAADKYVVSDGETLCWYYENTTITPLPTPP